MNEELRQFEEQLAKAHKQLSPEQAAHQTPRLMHTPTQEDLVCGVRNWYRQRLKTTKAEIRNIPDPVNRAKELELEEQLATIRLKVGSQASKLQTTWLASDVAQKYNWNIKPNDPEWQKLEVLLDRAMRELAFQQLSELNGAPVQCKDDTFSLAYLPDDKAWLAEQAKRPTEPLPITTLMDSYVKMHKGLSASTIKGWTRILRVLAKFLGHDDARAVTTDDLIRWRDHLLDEILDSGKRRSPKTVKESYFAAVKATFNQAVQDRKIEINPAKEVYMPAIKKQRLRNPGFTDAEARKILKATLDLQPPRLSAEMARARRWIPWICAYTGARVGEIAQLRAQDIKREEGVMIIHITPEAGTVKNDKARDVPLHPHLLEMGFIDMVKHLSGPIFYNPENYRGGSLGNPQYKKVGERLAKWVRKLGVDDPNIQPNHAWRHRFKTFCRRYNVHPDTSNAIMGHAPHVVAEGYGKWGELCTMNQAINTLPRIEL